MTRLADIYRPSLGLLTDLYELTMAQAYWRSGTAAKEAVFHLFFRKHPFDGGYAVACGIDSALDYLSSVRLTKDDVAYLSGLPGNDGAPLFDPQFLQTLEGMSFACDVDAVREGTLVFAGEPLLRVRGSILQAQLVETALLNLVNFATLIATKAARVRLAAGDDTVIEFGLRRAQGIDGGLTASRAAYVGGCDATSNVLAGRLYDIPVRGTHAHSWVMSFDSERQAFEAYAEAVPNNVVLLVDTYDSLEGVRHAVEVGLLLRSRGHELAGVRLDSGDLAYLSIEARKILDAAGFQKTAIVASNDLDEHLITSLKAQGAAITVWGVGTNLATGGSQSALGGVYKLGAVRWPGKPWQPRIKVSEQTAKATIPGIQQVRRYSGADGLFVADLIFDEERGPGLEGVAIDPADPLRRKAIPPEASYEDLLQPAMRVGKVVAAPGATRDVRQRVMEQLARLHPATKRFDFPHEYPVGLSVDLHDVRTRLVLEARRRKR